MQFLLSVLVQFNLNILWLNIRMHDAGERNGSIASLDAAASERMGCATLFFIRGQDNVRKLVLGCGPIWKYIAQIYDVNNVAA